MTLLVLLRNMPGEDAEKKALDEDICPKCHSPLGAVVQTKSGRQLRRCSNGLWNANTRQVDGCDYVKWIPVAPQELDEKCPKCGSSLELIVTRFGKKAKRCSTNQWDPATKTAIGCDYIEWLGGTTEPLDEDCPQCGSKLVMYTTTQGKKLKKCSTNSWDPQTRMASGCNFVQWL